MTRCEGLPGRLAWAADLHCRTGPGGGSGFGLGAGGLREEGFAGHVRMRMTVTFVLEMHFKF
jgi:hypothetical protein